MATIFGKNYYLNLDVITEKCKLDRNDKFIEENPDDIEDPDGIEINIFKYEVLKMCIDRVLNEQIADDEDMGVLGQAEFSASFKIAFNTLTNYEILIEKSDE